jgi:hypothetical protein
MSFPAIAARLLESRINRSGSIRGELEMIKRARLLAATLALAAAFGVPESAQARPILCGAAESFLSDINNAPTAGYSYWIMYWLDHCEG